MRARRTVAECPDCNETLFLDGDVFVHEVSENVECRRCRDCDEPLHRDPNGVGGYDWAHPAGNTYCVEDDGTPIPAPTLERVQ